MTKIWTNSGDSHFLEPDDLWQSRLPKRLAELTPRAEKDPMGNGKPCTSTVRSLGASCRPQRW
ncbi:amidohydrolase 2 domain protein [Mycobacterium xenopi 4042]|uniref:Amidohydrolase 2 domain protein n=1 Tax=Mycobacterium xenopi 4042 TaxID=1299334 RepID=X7ZUA6_MYCXE|nr:amidohydrolase 2 domain protein [Mycobacterium xenopi 4042]